MDSTPNLEQAGAHDARANEKLAGDYENTVREELARVQERLAKLVPNSAPDALEPKIAAFRPAAAENIEVVPEHRQLPNRGALRGFVGVVLAGCIVGGAVAWQSPYGDTARQLIARWAPQFASTSSAPTVAPAEQQAAPAESNPPAEQVATADQAAAQPAPAAPSTPPVQQAATTAAAVSPDLEQLLESMAHDLANLQQGIDQLKASQDQMARDNARVAEQLKANQEQITRLMAKVSEQNLHPRIAAPPSRPVAPVRRPVAMLPPPHALAPPPVAAQPQPPVQPQPEEPELLSAPRPPKPVP